VVAPCVSHAPFCIYWKLKQSTQCYFSHEADQDYQGVKWGHTPKFGEDCYLAENAVAIGDV
jgi:hypothetical protein